MSFFVLKSLINLQISAKSNSLNYMCKIDKINNIIVTQQKSTSIAKFYMKTEKYQGNIDFV